MRFGKKLAKLFCFMNDSSFWLSDFYYRVMGGFTRKYEPSSILTSNLFTNLLLERFLLMIENLMSYCVLECLKKKVVSIQTSDASKTHSKFVKRMVFSKR